MPVQKIAKLTGANAADVPELLAGSVFPDAKAQQPPALLDGGTAKAIGETAKFLKEQGKVETVLPDYSPYVSAKYITCLLYTSPSPRDGLLSRMPSSA